MRKQFTDLTDEEIMRIAKLTEHSHPQCVASAENLDPHVVHMCVARKKVMDVSSKKLKDM